MNDRHLRRQLRATIQIRLRRPVPASPHAACRQRCAQSPQPPRIKGLSVVIYHTREYSLYGDWMARKTQFSGTEVFAAVGGPMARERLVTTTAGQQAASLSTGSLYHRLGSCERLLAETWLFALRSFQSHFHPGARRVRYVARLLGATARIRSRPVPTELALVRLPLLFLPGLICMPAPAPILSRVSEAS